MFALGCLAFALFFLGDINDCWLRTRPLKICFPLGALLLAAATLLMCVKGEGSMPWPVRLAGAILAAACLGLMVWALFFSIPAKDAYVEQAAGRSVNDRKLYALCRHPGVLFFVPGYLGLWLCCGLPLYAAAVYSALNVALIVFEDLVVFPSVLEGYGEYRKSTPFLIPNRDSLHRCMADFRKEM